MDIRAIARQLMRTHGNQRKVARLLVTESKVNPELRNALIELGAAQVARDATTTGRKVSVGASAAYERPVLPHEAAMQARQEFWDTYTLFGGSVRLGDATRRELADSARKHDAQSEGHKAAAAFEREVGRRLPNDKQTVRGTLTLQTVEEIKRRAHAK